MKKPKPILFSSTMVNAIRRGDKTMTRRIVKLKYPLAAEYAHQCPDGGWQFSSSPTYIPIDAPGMFPPFQVGDVLWVREVIGYTVDARGQVVIVYRADDSAVYALATDEGEGDLCGVGKRAERSRCMPVERWKPAIHMPYWACRLWLEVTGVKVERVRDITEADAKAEGIRSFDMVAGGKTTPFYGVSADQSEHGLTARIGFAVLWEEINGPHSWDRNDWVFCYTFKQTSKPSESGTGGGE